MDYLDCKVMITEDSVICGCGNEFKDVLLIETTKYDKKFFECEKCNKHITVRKYLDGEIEIWIVKD